MSNFINVPQYKVSQFNRVFKEVIETNFDYLKIIGEISEIKTATRGQLYITLKDGTSILSGVIWDTKKKFLDFKLEIGMEVIVSGKITTWSRFKTTYQIDIDKVELAGQGALLKLIEDRKKRLESAGIFDQDKKKPLPYLPQKIGVITSPTGSVIYDIINRIRDRFPLKIDIWPVAVQGVDAPEQIIQAIQGFNSSYYKNKPDIIIIARGGGSTEDLMAFNDEKLALSVFESEIPIISAIGHETDTTIIDYVSDLRASTPTAAAELSVPMRIELSQALNSLSIRIKNFMDNKIRINNEYLNNINKFLKAPHLIIKNHKNNLFNIENMLYKEAELLVKNNFQKISNLNLLLKPPLLEVDINFNKVKDYNKFLKRFIKEKITYNKREVFKLTRLLESNSISKNLKKGYSIVTKEKKIVKNINKIKLNDTIRIKFSDESVDLEIKKIN